MKATKEVDGSFCTENTSMGALLPLTCMEAGESFRPVYYLHGSQWKLSWKWMETFMELDSKIV